MLNIIFILTIIALAITIALMYSQLTKRRVIIDEIQAYVNRKVATNELVSLKNIVKGVALIGGISEIIDYLQRTLYDVRKELFAAKNDHAEAMETIKKHTARIQGLENGVRVKDEEISKLQEEIRGLKNLNVAHQKFDEMRDEKVSAAPQKEAKSKRRR